MLELHDEMICATLLTKWMGSSMPGDVFLLPSVDPVIIQSTCRVLSRKFIWGGGGGGGGGGEGLKLLITRCYIVARCNNMFTG